MIILINYFYAMIAYLYSEQASNYSIAEYFIDVS